MSESPEVADDPPAIKALREQRKRTSRWLANATNERSNTQRALEKWEEAVSIHEAELADIDRALSALSYPD